MRSQYTSNKLIRTKKSKGKGGIKRTNMPLWGENMLNFWLRILLGAGVFWLLYYPRYHLIDETYFTQMSYIMLYNLAASFTAMLLSYFMILFITKRLKRPKKGFFSLNQFPDLQSILYELLSVTINAGLMATGLIIFLQGESSAWEQFFLLYCAMKIISRLIAFSLAFQISKNLMMMVAFFVAFAALLSIALLELTQFEVFPK